jgi:acetyl esterase/lipase
MSLIRPIAALVAVLPLAAGCTGLAFLAANAPVAFAPHERIVDLAYGPERRQRLDVYTPVSPAGVAARRPVVVFIHGGSWQTGSKDQYRFVGHALADQGLVAVVINYRLNPDVQFPAFVDDAAAAVAWTLRNIGDYGGDPGQVFVMGHSAGAHSAILLALDARYLAGAGASADDLRGAIGLSGPYDFSIESPALRAIFGTPADVAATQPVSQARGDAPPLLLIHGTADRVCWVTNSIRLTERVRRTGGRAELRLYPGLGHSATISAFTTLRPASAPTLQDVTAFITGG